MSTSQSTTAKPQRRFQFIDNSNVSTNGHNSTQVRRHVMQEYMREKRWEARSQAETALFDHDPQRHACRLPEVEVKRRNTRQKKKDDPKLIRTSPSTNHPTAASKKTIIVRLKKDDFHGSESWPRTISSTAIPNQTKYSPSLWRQSEAQAKVLKRGFFLDAGSFAQLADTGSDTLSTPPIQSSTLAHQPPSPLASMEPSYHHDGISKCSSPVMHLSAARTDPFDVLPLPLSTRDQELFDFYATVMPSYSHSFEGRHPQTYRWCHDVLIPEAMKCPISFQNTVLQTAAVAQASIRGLHETELALYHKARATKMLEDYCRKFPESIPDGRISATVSAAALTDLDPSLEQKKCTWHHWAVVMHHVRLRGGPTALEQKSSLCKLINWHDYILSGYDGRGSSFYFTPESSLTSSKEKELEIYGRQEIVKQCEEFLVFLRCIDQLALVAASQSDNPIARQYQSFRYSIFAPNQPLYNLLGNESRLEDTAADPLRRRICRLASQITINVAIWEHRYDNKRSEAFLEELIDNIMSNQLDKHKSAEVLLQILLYNSDSPASGRTERPWLVGRLLKVAKRLSRSSWEWLDEFLWSCLTLTDHRGGRPASWENRLRQEIVEAPLYNHSLSMLED